MANNILKYALLSVIVVFSMTSCIHNPYDITSYTYPPQFQYIPKEKLESTMWQLAFHIQELDHSFKDEQDTSIEFKNSVLAKLKRIEDAATALSGKETNHPLLNKHLSHFVSEVGVAKSAAQLNPPNYYFAKQLNGACSYCHYAR